MISIIDYGMGNLHSVYNALKTMGFDAVVTSEKEDIYKSKGVILPGVGAFPDCMNNLKKLGLTNVIKEIIFKKPFLGICLGLQLLFKESEEFGPAEGLGIFQGRVRKFPENMKINNEKLKIPHMGWNKISKKSDTPFLKGIPDNTYFYFVHSFYVECDDNLIATTTYYGINFVSSIYWQDTLFACQFHPEKSQKYGLKILENFANIAYGRNIK
ncbi:MAG: imidazole glycerol phosphate synthase subunit HisH [Proteobacteria bacterium]|nr:imidazole glycerol phosphate synthase subunit HisH [Pseudomonadota bacterium]